MHMRVIASKKVILKRFEYHLRSQEKAPATIEKYLRDAKNFLSFIQGKAPVNVISRNHVVAYKASLITKYAPASVNSMIASINALLMLLGCPNMRVKRVCIQRELYRNEHQDLTKREYERLCAVAKQNGKERVLLVMQTICATGIRVSELCYITVEAAQKGKTVIHNKGKIRVVWIPENLQKILLHYALQRGIKTGVMFRTRAEKPLHRSYIWREMKELCDEAEVTREKVYPHNLRHLFAQTFNAAYHDLGALSDILGHSKIETTRIYTISTGQECREQLQALNLV